MKKQLVLFFIVIATMECPACYGQNLPDSIKTYRIEMNDGNIFIGSITDENPETLVLKTDSYGELRILQINIKSKTELTELIKVGGKFWLPNPQSARYFWAPNGFGLEKGSSYYQNIWVLYNQASVGVFNNFSIGAGVIPLFLFAGASTPVWLIPKISIPVVKEKFNIGTGAFLGTVLGEKSGLFGLLYGTSTLGSRDKNVSVGLAYGFIQDHWIDHPVINLSSMIRYGPKGYFITENYAIPIDGDWALLFSLGGRSIIRNVGLDYSLWIPCFPETDTFVAIPFLGVTVPLGKKRK